MPTPGNELDRVALEWLLLRGVPAWRNNTGAYMRGKAFIRYGMKGSSDILGILPPSGRFLAAEGKQEYEKVSVPQQQFLEAGNEAGGLGFVFRSLDELIESVSGALPDGAAGC